jgi:UDP-N-acetylmuramoyl-tripeptide--D-alanyl-D-alanine ligase
MMNKNTSIEKLYELFKQSSGVSTDTRKVNKNNLFIALKGANFNGNEFAEKALELGASAVIVDEKKYATNDLIFLVDDALKTLQDLANHHRKQFEIPFIGITGSNGKTTSKELIACVLQTSFKTHFTLGNLNNHIGVPLTLLSMPADTEIAVIEMGANKIGDIEELVNIAEPTHGLITNIGKAHLEGFGSVEGIIKGKSELFDFLDANNGVIFINDSSEILRNLAHKFKNHHRYSQTNENAFVFGKINKLTPFIDFQYDEFKQNQTQLIGSYNFENILAALSIGKYFKVDAKKAIDAICHYVPSNNRSQIIEKEGLKIILDAYNANPTSMNAAITNFASISSATKISILGDMFELGETSNEEHLALYKATENKKFTQSYFVGKNFKKALPNAENVFETKDLLINQIKNKLPKEALILIKGSRGIGLETILEEI